MHHASWAAAAVTLIARRTVTATVIVRGTATVIVIIRERDCNCDSVHIYSIHGLQNTEFLCAF
jgi:hypothetical protein